MEIDEIQNAYDVLAQNVRDQAATEAAAIGNAQRSLGPLAAAVASPTGQTSGLANYTYNRLFRPAVDSTAAALTTKGKAAALEKYLTDSLRNAKNAYEYAKSRYAVASTAPKTSIGGKRLTGGKKLTDTEQVDESGSMVEAVPYTPRGTIISTGTSNGTTWDVVVADGKGGFERREYIANSAEEAKNKFREEYAAVMK